MATFVTPVQDEKYRIYNMPVNIEHVQTITKGMNGFQHALIFAFNKDQSFEWRYRNAADRDMDYDRLMLLIHTQGEKSNKQ